tara:strand:+ start:18288 stop:18980 length:693 start_codon:yes stop_codon:yes gene_type:complete
VKNIENIAIIVQARLNSERVPRKMLRDFAGTSLLDITLQKLVDSDLIANENVWLSVHEPELIEIGEKYGINIFVRSEGSANSEGERLTEIYEWWDKIPHEYCILVNACAPFLELGTIEKFLQFYANIEDFDLGAFAVIAKRNYFWRPDGTPLLQLSDSCEVMNTKMVPVTYEAAHCLYASKLSKIGEGNWMGDFNKVGDIKYFPVEEGETFDIDYEWQFERAVKIYNAQD